MEGQREPLDAPREPDLASAVDLGELVRWDPLVAGPEAPVLAAATDGDE